jgi:hypothetical protein
MDIPADLIITVRDISRAGFCIARGAKPWFRDHDLDFREFLKNGILATELAATGDAIALQVVSRTIRNRCPSTGSGQADG